MDGQSTTAEPAPASAAERTLLQVPPALGRLAAVQRTLVWALDQRGTAARSSHLGASCARLVADASAVGGLDDATTAQLVELQQQLVALDGLQGRERAKAARSLLRQLAGVVPVEVVVEGIPVPDPPEAPPAEVPAASPAAPEERASAEPAAPDEPQQSPEPDRRRERRPRKAKARRSRAASEEADKPAAEAPDDADEGRGGKRRRRRRSRKKPAETEAPAAAPKPEPAPASALPLAHPELGGRPVETLSPMLGASRALLPDELAALQAAGIETVADLLDRVPARHWRPQRGRSGESEPALWRGKVVSRCVRIGAAGRRWELCLSTRRDHSLTFRWLGDVPRGWQGWLPDTEIGLVGAAVETDDGDLVYEAEPVGLNGRGSGLLPCYDIDGIDDERVRALVIAGLDSIQASVLDVLPESVREDHRLLSVGEALRDAHFPANQSARGRTRLAFEELLLLQLGVAWRAGRGRPARGVAHRPLHELVGQLAHQHQIELDDAQELAFSEIRRDMRASAPMTRLLQGDVGTGKSRVALMAALVAVANGSQVAMVSPDALSAERRFLHIEPVLRSIGVNVLYVGDGPSRAQADAIRRGEVALVYGTRTLLADNLEWKRLGLVVVEERGPYGSVTPGSLRVRGNRPDLLVITRAPIPSSLAFTVFGDFDVSVLAGRGDLRVATTVFPPDARGDAYAQAKAAVEAGRQVFVVFPVRDGRDLLSTEDAQRMARALQSDLLKGARIGVYCSDMSRDERGRVYDDFQHRRVDVLICTTFIEDAPPVVNATEMVVEYADLHDVVRLHRLRAHVGQARLTGSCSFVMSGDSSAEGMARVELAQAELDGFRLAEVDLQERGARALLGDRAAEVPDLRWADPTRHRSLLLRARAEAFAIVSRDGELRNHPHLADAVSARWGDWLGQHIKAPPRRARTDRRRRRRRRRR